jgi:hypothetical protein
MAEPDPRGRPRAADPPGVDGGPTAERSGAQAANARRRRNVRRAMLAIAAVGLAEIVGTVGIHLLEGVGWINAFYFESMLATGQGPPFALDTNAGKIFASIMGFVSVGSTLSAVVFSLGPILSPVWRDLVGEVERGARRLEKDVAQEVRRLEDDLRRP